jgi:hypothetical protein
MAERMDEANGLKGDEGEISGARLFSVGAYKFANR